MADSVKSSVQAVPALPGNTPLEVHDPELHDIIEREKNRQWKSLELIASENFTSQAVIDCLGSALTNKYSEGLPHARYYGGNEYIDMIEELCQKRALDAYRLNPEQWGVNVQPYSGSPANFAVYTGLLKPHDRIMGLDLPAGGHLTHGYYTWSKAENTRKPVSATSIFFESLPYSVHPDTGFIDYEKLAEMAAIFKPTLIICGGSAYPREWDYKRFREIADANGALLMCDMAHISGLVATQEADDPFPYCDIVTTTTHKSLRGPRAGMIFFRKDARNFEQKINFAVFPGLQGGPHIHQIAGIATQLKEVATPHFKEYCAQVRVNARALANKLASFGHTLATGGTDNHLILWDLRPYKVSGAKYEKLCDLICITVNKNSIKGDRSAITPGGVRLGTPALTTRGFKEHDFEKVAELLHKALQVAISVQSELAATKAPGAVVTLVEFTAALQTKKELDELKKQVNALATSFPMPGFDISSMKYSAAE